MLPNCQLSAPKHHPYHDLFFAENCKFMCEQLLGTHHVIMNHYRRQLRPNYVNFFGENKLQCTEYSVVYYVMILLKPLVL